MGMSQTPRIILVHNEECEYSCPHCYYKYRNHRTIKDPCIVDEFMHSYKPDKVAIGFNSGWCDNELDILENQLGYGTNVVATCSLDNDLIMEVADQLDFDTDILCISYNDENISDKLYGNISRIWNKKILDITDDCISITEKLPGSFFKLASIVDNIYFLMTKGPVGKWKMTDDRIRIYNEKLDILRNIVSTPIIIDECVMGVLSNGIGNCKGDWLEVNSYGEVRVCPYSIEPTKTFRYGINLEEVEFPTICECRRSK